MNPLLTNIEGQLDKSLENEKKNDFLTGVPAIVDAIRTGQIACRVYKKDKFHAKAYLTHARKEVVGSFALVGSSNFTYPGLTKNIELNVRISGSQSPTQSGHEAAVRLIATAVMVNRTPTRTGAWSDSAERLRHERPRIQPGARMTSGPPIRGADRACETERRCHSPGSTDKYSTQQEGVHEVGQIRGRCPAC